jgi:hypothetical protein
MRLDGNADAVAAVAQRMLIVSDPPERNRLKRVLSKTFAPAEVARAERLVGHVVDEVLAEALSAAETDFVGVARLMPNRAVCTVMGIQRSDWDWLGNVATGAFEGPTRRSGASRTARSSSTSPNCSPNAEPTLVRTSLAWSPTTIVRAGTPLGTARCPIGRQLSTATVCCPEGTRPPCTVRSAGGLERGAAIAPGPFPRAARRTRRAGLPAAGSPRFLPLRLGAR